MTTLEPATRSALRHACPPTRAGSRLTIVACTCWSSRAANLKTAAMSTTVYYTQGAALLLQTAALYIPHYTNNLRCMFLEMQQDLDYGFMDSGSTVLTCSQDKAREGATAARKKPPNHPVCISLLLETDCLRTTTVWGICSAAQTSHSD